MAVGGGNGRRRTRQNFVADWMPLNWVTYRVMMGPFREMRRLEREGLWRQMKHWGIVIIKHERLHFVEGTVL